MDFDYDLLVIGAGPGGIAAAERAANYGAKVAIAEQDRVGGTCVVHGCIPEKLMTYAASFSEVFRNADEYGWGQVKEDFNWHQFMKARNNDIDHLVEVHINHLREAGVELIHGRAKFWDANTVFVEGKHYTARKILIAVGRKSVKPEIPGIEFAISSKELLTLERQPKHLAIVGSNHIAVKLAGIMNGLISKVTLIVPEADILPDVDEEIRTTIREQMKQLGVRFYRNSKVEKIEKQSDHLNLKLSQIRQLESVETIVFITERVANLDGLDLDRANVETDNGAIVTDEYARTSQDHIFAIGDCTPKPHWTPVAIAAGRAFADTEFGNKTRAVDYNNIPYVISSQPEAATVGLNQSLAEEKYDNVRCYSKKFQPLYNLMAESKQKTLLKLVVEGESERVVGAHMVGDYAAEIIQIIALAIRSGVTKRDFDRTIGIHPSIGEEFFAIS